MEHLTQEHNCQKILFVAGPAQNTDANERKNTYLEMMAKISSSGQSQDDRTG